jgi:hypothetical protein
MKNTVFAFAKFSVMFATAFIVACGSKSSNTNSDATANANSGCVIPGQIIINGYCAYPNGTGGTYSGIAFEQWVNVTDPVTYHKFLDDLDYCNNVNCNNVNYMTVRIDLMSTTLPSQGRVAISTGYDYPFVRVDRAYPVTGGFEFRVTGMFGTPSWNDVVRVTAVASDAQMNAVDVIVYYNNVAFATGHLTRIPTSY